MGLDADLTVGVVEAVGAEELDGRRVGPANQGWPGAQADNISSLDGVNCAR